MKSRPVGSSGRMTVAIAAGFHEPDDDVLPVPGLRDRVTELAARLDKRDLDGGPIRWDRQPGFSPIEGYS